MVAAGAERGGLERALNGVRDLAWGVGCTLRAKYVVLLASAEVIAQRCKVFTTRID